MLKYALVAAAVAFLITGAPHRANADPVISVGSFPASPPSYLPAPPAGTFLVPIDITGASNLQNWSFDLLFDNTVVEEVDPGDGSSGIYGAQFTPGDPNSMSFILAGVPLNFAGDVFVAGSYPSLPSGPSGNSVLAFVLFEFLPGESGNNPDFSIENASTLETQIPEPGTLALLVCMLVLFAGRVGLRRGRKQN